MNQGENLSEEDKNQRNEITSTRRCTYNKKNSHTKKFRGMNSLEKAQIQLKNAQKYLGLRPSFEACIFHCFGLHNRGYSNRITVPPDPLSDPRLGNIEKSIREKLSAKREALLKLQHIDVNKHVPYPLHQNVRMICVDVEAWERDHRIITEIGVAIFDTSRVEWESAGQCASDWRKHIEAKHFRIYEHENMINCDYVSNDPTGFRYGTTETIRLNDIPIMLEELFIVPENRSTTSEASQEFQDVVFIAHNAAADVKFLEQAGFDVANFPTVKDIIDTQALWQAINIPGEITQNIRLSKLLQNLGIPFVAGDLHNAGNDAVLTLHAFLAVSLLEGTLRPSIKNVGDENYSNTDCETMKKRKELESRKRQDQQDQLVAAISKLLISEQQDSHHSPVENVNKEEKKNE
jgi:hypothetical protein